MKIAIPVAKGRLSVHFAHVEEFALFDVDRENKTIVRQETFPAPEDHSPGVLPKWLIDNGVTMVIVYGMGSRAIAILEQKGITVLTGAPSEEPEIIVQSYLSGTLEFGDNFCEH